jgi:hypothetical protein
MAQIAILNKYRNELGRTYRKMYERMLERVVQPLQHALVLMPTRQKVQSNKHFYTR